MNNPSCATAIPSDSQLIRESWADPEQFAVVFDRHYRDVWRFIGAHVSGDVADELAAETFVAAFEGRRRFDLAYQNARPWLLGIASHQLSRHYRGRSRERRALARVGLNDTIEDSANESISRVSAAALRPALLAALARLPAKDRTALVLHVCGELSYEETAVALSVPVGTVKSRIARARRRLAASFVTGVERNRA